MRKGIRASVLAVALALVAALLPPSSSPALAQAQSTDATLNGITVTGETLSPVFASDVYAYRVAVAHDDAQVTVGFTKGHTGQTVDFKDGSDQDLADNVTGSHQVDLAYGVNTVKLVVTPQDTTADTGTYTLTLVRALPAGVTGVPLDWDGNPAGVSVNDQFRLMFVTRGRRDATSTDIEDYDAFVRDRIARNGPRSIREHSRFFKVLASTDDVSARDHTGTTFTNGGAEGVPIHWLNGLQLHLRSDVSINNYEQFWENSHLWYGSPRFEDGSNAGSSLAVRFWTGSASDGSQKEGATLGSTTVRTGRRSFTTRFSDSSGERKDNTLDNSTELQFLGLSGVFQVVGTLPAPELAALSATAAGESDDRLHGFTAGHRVYHAGFGAGVSQATLEWTAVNEAVARVSVLDADGDVLEDADGGESGHQVDLEEGLNTVTVRVWHTNSILSNDYTLHLGRGSTELGGWRAGDDVNYLWSVDDIWPRGMTGTADTLWVADAHEDSNKVLAFDRSDGSRVPGLDIELGSYFFFDFEIFIGLDGGIWSNAVKAEDGTASGTMWVGDSEDGTLFAYKVDVAADGTAGSTHGDRDEDKDFGLLDSDDNEVVTALGGLWSNGETMWVSDTSDHNLHAYKIDVNADGTKGPTHGDRDSDKDINVSDASGSAIVGDDTAIWVLNEDDNKLYAFEITGGARNSVWDIELHDSHESNGREGIETTRGAWIEGDVIYVGRGDNSRSKIFAYNSTRAEASLSLSALSVTPAGESDNRLQGFAADRTVYQVGLPAGVSQATINWTAADGTRVSVLDADGEELKDADDGEDHHQVDLDVGINAVTVRVLDTDAGLSGDYTLHLAVNSTELGGWRAGDDINYLSDVDRPRGISGTVDTLWVADALSNKVLAFDRSDGTRVTGLDIELNTGDGNERLWGGIWSDMVKDVDDSTVSGTMWVSDPDDHYLYAYKIAVNADGTAGGTHGDRDEPIDIPLSENPNGDPEGLWSNGSTMWVNDRIDDRLYAYKIAVNADGTPVTTGDNVHGARDSDKDIDVSSVIRGGEKPLTIVGDGTAIWVLADHPNDEKLYAFEIEGKARNSDWDIELHRDQRAGNRNRGAWIEGGAIYVGFGDGAGSKIFAYNTSRGTASQSLSALSVTAGESGDMLHGFASDHLVYHVGFSAGVSQATLNWTAEDGATVSVLNADGKELKDADGNKDHHQVALEEGLKTVIVRVLDTGSGVGNDYTLHLGVGVSSTESGGWRADVDVNYLSSVNGIWPRGMAGTVDTLWVADAGSNTVLAFDRSDGTRVTGLDIELSGHGKLWGGIWSDMAKDGTENTVSGTLWVADPDRGHRKLYAYKIAVNADGTPVTTGDNVHGERDEGKDIQLRSGNINPEGLWSNGSTMWVNDYNDRKLYAYKIDINADGTKGPTHGFRDSGKDINVSSVFGGDRSRAVVGDGTAIWVFNESDNKLYAFQIADKLLRNEGWDIDLHDSQRSGDRSRGAWIEGGVIYMGRGDEESSKAFAYNTTHDTSTSSIALSSLTLTGSDSSTLTLNPTFTGGVTYYEAASASAGEVTVAAVGSHANAGVKIAPVDADPNETGHQVAVTFGHTPIEVTATAPNGYIETYRVIVSVGEVEVPGHWELRPPGLSFGDRFRLLGFTTAPPAYASTSTIGAYNTFVQNNVSANGHDSLKAHSAAFRVLGCTAAASARANTGTEYRDLVGLRGVGVYWVDGAKVADDYADLYDGSWDSREAREVNGDVEARWPIIYDEEGNPESDPSIFVAGTGCDNDGFPNELNPLGNRSHIIYGDPGHTSRGPIYGYLSGTHPLDGIPLPPLMGLSPVFRLGLSANLHPLSVTAAGESGERLEGFRPDHYVYDVGFGSGVSQATIAWTADPGVTVSVTDSSDTAVDDADMADGHQVNLDAGLNTFKVKTSVPDTTATREYTLHLAVSSDAAGGWRAVDDINYLWDIAGIQPRGMAGTAATLWVGDKTTKTLLAFNRSDGSRAEGLDIVLSNNQLDRLHLNQNLDGGIFTDAEVAGDGSADGTMWVADDDDNRIFAYKIDITAAGEAGGSHGDRDSGKDISLITDNREPRGLWSDGTTMWVGDSGRPRDSDRRFYAYRLSNGSHNSGKDIRIGSVVEHDKLVGITGDGTALWALDEDDQKLYAFEIDREDRNSDWDISLHSSHLTGGGSFRGVWLSDDVMYVGRGDGTQSKAFAYNAHATSLSTDATLSALKVQDVPVDGFASDELAYTVDVAAAAEVSVVPVFTDDGASAAFLDGNDATITDSDNDLSNGLQAALPAGESTVQVVVTAEDGAATQTYVLTVRLGSSDAFGWLVVNDVDWLEIENGYPNDMWSDGTTLWVLDDNDDHVFAYTRDDGARNTSVELDDTALSVDLTDCGSDNDEPCAPDPVGLWSDGTTMWVVHDTDTPGNEKAYAYTLADRSRDSGSDLELHNSNSVPRSLWSDGTTMWVLNSGSSTKRLFAYALDGGARQHSKEGESREFDLHSDNANPEGIWSDGVTMWVVENDSTNSEYKLYAYTLDTGIRDSSKDFNTLAGAGQVWPLGLWSDGEVMWVAERASGSFFGDYIGQRLFSYKMPESDNVELGVVSVAHSGGALDVVPDPDDGTVLLAVAPADVAEVTVAVGARQLKAAAAITSPADSNNVDGGHQVSLPVTGTVDVSVTVTAQDTTTTGTYTVRLRRQSADASLSALSVMDQTLDPAFAPGKDAYTVNVAHDVDSAEVSATANDAAATVVLSSVSGTPPSEVFSELADSAGKASDTHILTHTVTSLAEGDNLYRLRVTAEDGTTGDYRLTVSRAAAAPSTDASLSGLTVQGVEVDGFASATLAYAVGVAAAGSVSVVPAFSDDGASAAFVDGNDNAISDSDNDLSNGLQAALPAGVSTVKVVVTAEDNTATQTYVLTVRLGSSEVGVWKVVDDVEWLDSTNWAPRGLWSDGTTLWVADDWGNRVFAYTWPGGVRQDGTSSTDDLELDDTELTVLSNCGSSGNDKCSPAVYGVWRGADALWVLNYDDPAARVHPYDISTGAPHGTLQPFGVPAAAGDAAGLWSDGSTLWTVDADTNRVYAFDLSSGLRLDGSDGRADREFDLHGDNGNAQGIWSDGVTVWVTEADESNGDDKLYAYNLADGSRAAAKDLATTTAGVPRWTRAGIWSDGVTMWVSAIGAGTPVGAGTGQKLYSFNMPVSDNAELGTVTVTHSGGTLDVVVDPDDSSVWVAVAPAGVDEVTVAVGARQLKATVAITSPADSNGTDGGHQVDLSGLTGDGTVDVSVTVTAQDTTTGTYTLRLRRPSADATLSALSVGGTAVPGFAADKLEYTVSVAHDVAEVTALWTLGDDTGGARFETLDGSDGDLSDADGNDGGFQVALGAEDSTTTFKIKVTAEDGTTTATYTVNVVRAAAPSTDATLSGLTVAGVAVDGFMSATLAYAVDVAAAGSVSVVPVFTDDGASAAFLDGDDNAISDSDNDLSNGLQAALPAGVSTVKVVVTAEDNTATQTYVLTVRLGSSEPFGWRVVDDVEWLAAANGTVVDMWSDGETLWAADDGGRVFAYTWKTEARAMSKELGPSELHLVEASCPGNPGGNCKESPLGVWSDGTTMWVPEAQDSKVYAYKLSDRSRVSESDVSLDAGNDSPSGTWSDGTTLWVLDTDRRAYAYSLADGSRQSGLDVDVGAVASPVVPAGVWSDGVVMWVAASDSRANSDSKLLAFNLDDGSRVTALDFETLAGAGNDRPRGLWSDGTIMWVAQRTSGCDSPGVCEGQKLYSFNMPVSDNADLGTVAVTHSGGTLDVVVDPDDSSVWVAVAPAGVDEVTVAVGARQLKATVAITSPADSNGTDGGHQVDLSGLTGDGTVDVSVTVTAQDTTTTETYTLRLRRPSTDATLSALSVGGTAVPGFAADKLEYTVSVAHDVAEVTASWTLGDESGASAATLDSGDSALADADGNDSGFQVTLGAEGSETVFKVKVTAEDGATTATYVVTVNRAAAASTDASLSGLSVAGVAVDGFMSDVLAYTVDVAAAGSVSVVPVFTDDGASAAFVDGDDNAISDSDNDLSNGLQAALPAGVSTVKVVVTAEDNTATQTYVLTVRLGSSEPFGWRVVDDVEWLAAANGTVLDMWSDGETLWAADDGGRVFAYTWETGARDTAEELDDSHLAVAASDCGSGSEQCDPIPHGVWSDGDIMWVLEAQDRKVYAYDMSDRSRASGSDVALASDNSDPLAIWSDGDTLWVVDDVDSHVYAYALDGGSRRSGSEFSVGIVGKSERGIWSDGVTMWVAVSVSAADEDSFVAAFDLDDKSRVTGLDFETLAGAGNDRPLGLWSDGEVMWVGQATSGCDPPEVCEGQKLYSYNMPVSDNAELGTVAVTHSGGTLDVAVDPDDDAVRLVVVPAGVDEVTVAVGARQLKATAAITSPADSNNVDGGHQVDLSGLTGNGTVDVAITVTAQDTTTTETYTVTFSREPVMLAEGVTAVPDGWALTPSGLSDGDQFRLLALTVSERDATATDIADYDSHVRADIGANGHAAVRSLGGLFTVLGCTSGVDANDHTGTTYTDDATGVPVYWLGAAKVADHYKAFYTEDWQSRVSKTTSGGDNSRDVWTGCSSDGTAHASGYLGAASEAQIGDPEKAGDAFDANTESSDVALPLYALSGVFQVVDDLSAPELAALSATAAGESDDRLHGFAADHRVYHAGFSAGVSQATLEWTAVNEDVARVSVLDADGDVLEDADDMRDHHQVNLEEGLNTVTVRVSHTNNVLSTDYTLHLGRSSTELGGWRAGDDVNYLWDTRRIWPRGIAGTADTLWVADGFGYLDADDVRFYKVLAFDRSDGSRVPGLDIELGGLFGFLPINPNGGIWSDAAIDDNDGTASGTMWVAAPELEQIFAYKIAVNADGTPVTTGSNVHGDRDEDKDFWLLDSDDNFIPSSLGGLWSNGSTMWVSDPGGRKLYAFHLEGESHDSRDEGKDINVSDASGRAIVGDDTAIWVLNEDDNKLYAFEIEGKARNSGWDIELHATHESNGGEGVETTRGAWIEGGVIYVGRGDNSRSKIFAYNTTRAADTTLRTLVVTDSDLQDAVLSPPFASDIDSYTAGFAAGTSTVTVTPTATDLSATVEYFDGDDMEIADADDNAAGHQVDLSEGANTVKVKVTGSDNLATRTYVLTLNLGSADDGKWKAVDDIPVLATANDEPRGLFRVGDRMYVLDGDGALYAYDTSTKLHDSGAGFTLATGNDDPRGSWSNGTVMWVADAGDDKLYAYAMSDGTRQDGTGATADLEFDLADHATDVAVDNGDPRGIWSNGTTMWVADAGDDKLYAYALSDGTRQDGTGATEDLEFDLADHATDDAADNGDPDGIWSDGITMWVADTADDKLYAYALDGGARTASLDFDNLIGGAGGSGGSGGSLGSRSGSPDQKGPVGQNGPRQAPGQDNSLNIWSDGDTLWAASGNDDAVYSYNMPRSPNADLSDLTVSEGELNPAFASATTAYTVEVATGVSAVTVTAATAQIGATVAYSLDTDTLTPGAQVDLSSLTADNTVVLTITVTSQDTMNTKSYTVTFSREAADPSPVTLKLRRDESEGEGISEISENGGTAQLHATLDPTVDGPVTITVSVPDDSPVTLSSTTLSFAANADESASPITITPSDDAVRSGPRRVVFTATVTTGSDLVDKNPLPITLLLADDEPVPVGVGRYDSSRDFNLATDNARPRGVWSDGTTLWVVDQPASSSEGPHKLFAYGVAEGSTYGTRIESSDWTLASHGVHKGVWSNRTTLWAVDKGADDLRAYLVSNRAYQRFDSFALDSSNANPGGVWSDGTTIWVVNDNPDSNVRDKVFAYDFTGKYDTNYGGHSVERDLPLHVENDAPEYIWSDGRTMWVTDADDQKLYAYKMVLDYGALETEDDDDPVVITWQHDPGQDLALHASNDSPVGIWSDGITLWVVNDSTDSNVRDKVFAYDLPPKATLALSQPSVPEDDATVTATVTASIDRTSSDPITFTVGVEAGAPAGATSPAALGATTTLTIPAGDLVSSGAAVTLTGIDDDKSTGPRFAAVTAAVTAGTAATPAPVALAVADDEPVPLHEFVPNSLWDVTDAKLGNGDVLRPLGVWADGAHLWVSAGLDSQSPADLHAYDLSTGTYGAYDVGNDYGDLEENGRGFEFEESGSTVQDYGNNMPVGIWSNGTTLWVADEGDGTEVAKVYAYHASTRAADPDKDFDLDSSNDKPIGLWSDGTTMWVAQNRSQADNTGGTPDKLFAYTLADGERDTAKEFNLHSGNREPGGLWSDGTTMWVADSTTNPGKLFAYTLATGARDSDKDLALVSAITRASGLWSDGETLWVVQWSRDDVKNKVFGYRLKPEVSLSVDDAVIDENGGSATLTVRLSEALPVETVVDLEVQLDAPKVPDSAPLALNSAQVTIPAGLRGQVNQEVQTQITAVDDEVFTGPRFARAVASSATVLGTPSLRMIVTDDETAPVGTFQHEKTVTISGESTSVFSGAWTDGEHIWISESIFGGSSKLAAYGLEDNFSELGSLDSDHVVSTGVFRSAGGRDALPHDIWSDGTTMWVADSFGNEAYAFTRNRSGDWVRDEDKDFDPPSTHPNGTPNQLRYFWSDGITIWFGQGNRVYAFNWEIGADGSAGPNFGDRDPDKDFNLHADNGNARGLWSDGTTMWVADFQDNKLYAYTLSSGARDSGKDLALHTDNDSPRGIVAIWSAESGVSLGVLDTDDKIYVYRQPVEVTLTVTPDSIDEGGAATVTASADRPAVTELTITVSLEPEAAPPDGTTAPTLSANTLTIAEGDTTSTGDVVITAADDDVVTADRTITVSATATGGHVGAIEPVDLTIVDNEPVMVLFEVDDADIDENGGSATLSVSLSKVSGADTVVGLGVRLDAPKVPATNPFTLGGTSVTIPANTSAGTAVEVTITAVDDEVFTGPRFASVVATSVANINGVADPVPLRIVVADDETASFDGFEHNPLRDFDVGTGSALGIWSDGETIWVSKGTRGVLGFDTSGNRASDQDLSLGSGRTSLGIWSDGSTMWASAIDDDPDRAFAYSRQEGSSGQTSWVEDTDKRFELSYRQAGGTRLPWGMWSDGETLWVANNSFSSAQDRRLLGYDFGRLLADGGRPDSTFVLPSGQARVGGVWSDGTTLWVSDYNNEKLFAYRASDGTSDSAKDFELDTDNGDARDIWSDGTTLWVVDDNDDKVYAYTRPVEVTLTVTPDTVLEGSSVTVTASTDRPAEAELAITVSLVEAPKPDGTTAPTLGDNAVLTIAKGAAVSSGTPVTITAQNDDVVTDDRTITVKGVVGGTAATRGPVTDLEAVTLTIVDNDGDQPVEISTASPIVPSDLGVGDQFRWLAQTTTSGKASSSSVSTYDTRVRNNISSIGHSAIRASANRFKALVCTLSTDARDHTDTTYTADDKGVPVYWFRGDRVADDYEDFYDGSWSSNSPRNASGSGTSGHSNPNSVFSGCDDDGTAASGNGNGSGSPHHLGGSDLQWTTITTPETPNSGLRGGALQKGNDRNILGLSDVFTVAAVGLTDLRVTAFDFDEAPDKLHGFDPGHKSYHVGFDNSVKKATITFALNSAFRVSYLDGNGDPLTDADQTAADNGFQVNLTAGDLTTVTVKAEKPGQSLLTQEHTLHLGRSSTVAGEWRAGHDINYLWDTENIKPRGVWGTDKVLWVANDHATSPELLAFDRSDGSRLGGEDGAADLDIDLSGDNEALWGGIFAVATEAGDGSVSGTLWVADPDLDGAKLYAYKIDITMDGAAGATHGDPDTGKDIGLHTDNAHPAGMWSNGTTMWVGDFKDAKVYAYKLTSDGYGDRDSGKDIDATGEFGADHLRGVASDGTALWALNIDADKLFGYKLADQSRNSDWDITLHTSHTGSGDIIRGVWHHDGVVYVPRGDGATHSKVYAYNTTHDASLSSDAALSALSVSPGGLNETFAADTLVYTVDVAHGETSVGVSATANDAAATVALFSVSGTPPQLGGRGRAGRLGRQCL